MIFKVKNGERRQVEFIGTRGRYVGLAAVEEVDGRPALVCFVGKRADLGDVAVGTVGEVPVRVLQIDPSEIVRGMVKLTVELLPAV